MAESTRLADLVQARIDDFLADRTSILASVSPDLAPISVFSREFLSGGKRFRAQFCYHGWQAATGTASGWGGEPHPSVVTAAAALEVFHAAALIHDDIIDNSDTRRGAPSAHRRFEQLHRDGGLSSDAGAYGRATALLIGDLLLGFSDELIDASLGHADAAVREATRGEFNRMRLEVTAGQYLDILEENAWRTRGEGEQLDRAMRVIVYKSAKYSVEAPLVLGASLGGASGALIEALRAFGLPLGVAFQLRDDLLGVFGDAEVTGKPSGDDLREGKRTVLIALARRRMSPDSVRMLDDLIGDRSLDDDQVAELQKAIAGSGARDAVETMIDDNVSAALEALDAAALDDASRQRLRELAARVARRDS
ncbi:polyprenyl synthetase family protein [Microbacterium sp. STN6]|uniref:polyprenyl synthetase family protein n=1 Tax=Microbacterium sp. STN6 TaxID=2995588 RepID=UPI0022609734|nr:polyprenyl synthetase family protein [Microbacterium sp. STN6]MCX7521500.1 polyprenyl synthetase family protein [Microbacterium sp. STN6]